MLPRPVWRLKEGRLGAIVRVLTLCAINSACYLCAILVTLFAECLNDIVLALERTWKSKYRVTIER